MWRTSSHSNFQANCIEASAAWRKSGYSHANGNCVEVAAAGRVLVRDSKDPGGPVLSFSRAEWATLVSSLKS